MSITDGGISGDGRFSEPEEVAENVAAAADSSPLTVEELERVEAMRRARPVVSSLIFSDA